MSGKDRPRRSPRDWTRLTLFSVVVAALAAVLAVGSIADASNGQLQAVGHSASLLPEARLAARTTTVWNCPGPLELTGGTASVAVANAGSHEARVTLRVSETALVAGLAGGHRLPAQVIHEVVPAGSDLAIPLVRDQVPARLAKMAATPAKKKGTRQEKKTPKASSIPVEAAVSVTAGSGAVDVSETAAQAGAVESSACALGEATHGYTASGATLDASQVHLAVFDPSAAPAVVNLSVGTPQGLQVPQALQGIVVPPESLAVVDLARYVPQAARVAVAATATVGHIVIGSLTTLAEHFTERSLGHKKAYTESGSSLAVGIGRPLHRFAAAVGPPGPRAADGFNIFNPGRSPAKARLVLEDGGTSTTLSLTVLPGQTLSELFSSLGKSSAAKAGKKAAPAAPAIGASPFVAGGSGVVTLSVNGHQGVVVSHETTVTSSSGHIVVLQDAATARPTSRWLFAEGFASTARGTELALTDAGKSPETAQIEMLPGGAGAAPDLPATTLQTVSLEPGNAVWVNVGKLAGATGLQLFGLLVKANGPVLVTGAVVSSGSGTAPALGTGVAAR